MLGDDFLRTVDNVDLDWATVSDAEFDQIITGLPHTKYLSLVWCRQLTDAGLEIFKGLNQLQQLDLSKTNVTDAGLEHLKGLNRLIWVDLSHTQVTEEGVSKLQKALPNCKIEH